MMDDVKDNKIIPATSEEEKRPDSNAKNANSPEATNIEDAMRQEEHANNLKRNNERDRFGQWLIISVLVAFLYLVAGEAVLLILGKPIPNTLTAAVDLFKFVVTTALGYIFGKASSK